MILTRPECVDVVFGPKDFKEIALLKDLNQSEPDQHVELPSEPVDAIHTVVASSGRRDVLGNHDCFQKKVEMLDSTAEIVHFGEGCPRLLTCNCERLRATSEIRRTSSLWLTLCWFQDLAKDAE